MWYSLMIHSMDLESARRLRAQLASLQRRLRREVGHTDGVSVSAHHVLGAILRLPPGSGPSQVADELNMAGSNVAAALRELERAALIRRERDQMDGRRTRLFVTNSGSEMTKERREDRDSWFLQALQATLTQKEQDLLMNAGNLMERVFQYEYHLRPDPERSGRLESARDGGAA